MVANKKFRPQLASPTSTSVRCFKEMPGKNLVDEFLGHIKSTQYPETFPGIFTGPIDKAETFWKLASFQIDPTKRSDSQLAFCPMCLQKNKYKSGDLVWIPKFQCIAAIGHECADKEIRRRASDAFKIQQHELYCEEYLIETLPRVHGTITKINDTLIAAEDAQKLFRKLHNDAELAKILIAHDTDATGRLSILVKIETQERGFGPRGLSKGIASDFERHDFGKLDGDQIALRSQYNPVSDFKRLRKLFESVNLATNDEAALEIVSNQTFDEKDRHAKLLKNLYVQLAKQEERLKLFSMFFRPKNLRKLQEWTKHPLSLAHFSVSWTESLLGLQVCIRGKGNNLFYTIPKSFFEVIDRL